MKKLRILFTVLSALCLACLLPAGTLGGLPCFLSFAGAAALFFLLMLLCKRSQNKDQPPEPDFLQNKSDKKSDKANKSSSTDRGEASAEQAQAANKTDGAGKSA